MLLEGREPASSPGIWGGGGWQCGHPLPSRALLSVCAETTSWTKCGQSLRGQKNPFPEQPRQEHPMRCPHKPPPWLFWSTMKCLNCTLTLRHVFRSLQRGVRYPAGALLPHTRLHGSRAGARPCLLKTSHWRR